VRICSCCESRMDWHNAADNYHLSENGDEKEDAEALAG
jgi:hypothetical protein